MRCYNNYCAIGCSFVLAIIGAACGDATERPRTHYYDSAVLRGRALPEWDGTNRIPLSPDQAVASALRFAASQQSNAVQWKIQRVTLEPDVATTNWFYKVYLIERGGNYRTELIYVLLDGEVWKPRKTITQ